MKDKIGMLKGHRDAGGLDKDAGGVLDDRKMGI